MIVAGGAGASALGETTKPDGGSRPAGLEHAFEFNADRVVRSDNCGAGLEAVAADCGSWPTTGWESLARLARDVMSPPAPWGNTHYQTTWKHPGFACTVQLFLVHLWRTRSCITQRPRFLFLQWFRIVLKMAVRRARRASIRHTLTLMSLPNDCVKVISKSLSTIDLAELSLCSHDFRKLLQHDITLESHSGHHFRLLKFIWNEFQGKFELCYYFLWGSFGEHLIWCFSPTVFRLYWMNLKWIWHEFDIAIFALHQWFQMKLILTRFMYFKFILN